MGSVILGLLAGIALGIFTTYAPMAARVRTLEAAIADSLGLIDEALGALATLNAPDEVWTDEQKADDRSDFGIHVVDPDGRTVGTALIQLPPPN